MPMEYPRSHSLQRMPSEWSSQRSSPPRDAPPGQLPRRTHASTSTDATEPRHQPASMPTVSTLRPSVSQTMPSGHVAQQAAHWVPSSCVSLSRNAACASSDQ